MSGQQATARGSWSEQSVDTLVGHARLRSADAFAELIRRFERVAMAIAYGQTRNATDAGDIVQEAFLRAWQRLDSLDDPARFSQWLGRMVRNLAIDHRRRKRPGSLGEDVDVPDDVPASTALEQAEQKSRIDRALAGLDEMSRTCIVLRYYQDLSSKDIGELLDLSPAAVDMRISRARTHLRDRLGMMSEEPAD